MGRSNSDQDYNDDKEIKKAHHFISLKKKQKLIELVEKGNFSIYKAAQRLKICHPTAKFIMKTHRNSTAIGIEQVGTTNGPTPTSPTLQNTSDKNHSEQNSAISRPNEMQSSPAVQNQPIPDQNTAHPQFWAYYSCDYFLPSIYYI